MHSTLRLTLVFISGIVLGLVLSVVGMVVLVRSGAADSLLRSAAVQGQSWPDVAAQLEQKGFTPQQQQQAQAALQAPIVFAVPSGYATGAYVNAFTGVLQDLQAFASTTIELTPILIRMNQQSVSGDFNGFFGLVYQAKALVAQQEQIASQLGQHVSALAAANNQTADASTKTLTDGVLAALAPTQSDIIAYNGLLNQLLSGSIPSADLVSQVADMGKKLGDDATAFGTALSPLLKRIGSVKK